MEYIGLRDFPKAKIYLLLEKSFRKELIERVMLNKHLKNYFELSKWINIEAKRKELVVSYNGGDIARWVMGNNIDTRTGRTHPKYMPLWIILLLVDAINSDIKEVENKVVAYRSGGSGNIVRSPILPVRVTPELVSIILHLFGDGHAGNHTPAYYQKDQVTRAAFIRKVKNCFGTFDETIHEKKWQVRFPKATTDILMEYFKIDSFGSHTARIPEKILRADNQSKLAALTAFIVDEGYIRDIILVCSVNKIMLSQIREMAESAGYECNPIQYGIASNSYSFTIRNRSLIKLNEDICKLIVQYPACDLYHKRERFDNLMRGRI